MEAKPSEEERDAHKGIFAYMKNLSLRLERQAQSNPQGSKSQWWEEGYLLTTRSHIKI